MEPDTLVVSPQNKLWVMHYWPVLRDVLLLDVCVIDPVNLVDELTEITLE